jgi:TPR repeat protein
MDDPTPPPGLVQGEIHGAGSVNVLSCSSSWHFSALDFSFSECYRHGVIPMDEATLAWMRRSEDYGVERPIGTGTFGTVSLVRHRDTGDAFARRDISDDVRFGASPTDKIFFQEIEFFMKVTTHPAICAFHGFICAPSRGVLLEYLPAGSLHTILTTPVDDRPSWYTPTVQAKIIFGFAAAMMHLHAQGAIHRYLTPKNIMFDANHEPKLCDFALAKITLNSTQLSQIVAGENAPYVAPEARDSTGYDRPLDVFAYAMIVNHLLRDERPFSHCRNPSQVGDAIGRDQRPPVPDCSQILQAVMTKGWLSAPNERPTFAEIVSRLMVIDEPIIDGVNMSEYREYRSRVFEATRRRFEDRSLFELRADTSPEKLAEFEGIRSGAEAGDPEKMVRLARFLERGHGVVQDDREAARWYEKAARAGNATGMFGFAIAAHNGKGRARDYPLAAEWYARAEAQGNQTAAVWRARMIEVGQGMPANPEAAAAVFQKMAEAPLFHKEAQYYLGVMLDEGRGVPKDHLKAMRYFELSHRQDIDGATCDLAMMHLEGRPGIPVNFALGIQTYEQAAGRGHGMSHYNLGLICNEGKYGTRIDKAAARAHFELAAQQNVTQAQVKFGSILVSEARGTADETEKKEKLARAARFFEKAAGDQEHGDATAQNNFGKMLMTGEGVPQDYRKAKMYLGWAEKQGSLMACVNLADIIGNGRDMSTPNRRGAIQLLKRACNGGDPYVAQLASDALAAL